MRARISLAVLAAISLAALGGCAASPSTTTGLPEPPAVTTSVLNTTLASTSTSTSLAIPPDSVREGPSPTSFEPLLGLDALRLDVTPRAGVQLTVRLEQPSGSNLVHSVITVTNKSQSTFSLTDGDFTLQVDDALLRAQVESSRAKRSYVAPGTTAEVTDYFWVLPQGPFTDTALSYASTDSQSIGFNKTVRVLESPAVPATTTTVLVPAVDGFLKMLRLDVKPRDGVRVAIGGLREVPSDKLDSRKRLIEGELIIENRSSSSFSYGPNDFRLYVGPFQFQILGMTASTEFPVKDAILAPVQVGDHAFLSGGSVASGETLHGYLLTWVADKGTESYGLQYNPDGVGSGGDSYMNRIQP